MLNTASSHFLNIISFSNYNLRSTGHFSLQFRLLFHDCMPYEGKSGGCDGCLNFEKNGGDHNVLQHSVAILVNNKQLILSALKIPIFY